MQTVANIYQDHLGVLPSAVQTDYKPAPGDEKMRALAWFGNKDVRMVDAPKPTITQPDDIILKVTGSTICGSDLHLYHGEILGLQKGDILGHEFMGVVDKVGPNVKGLREGDRVVTAFAISCGDCRFCKQKLTTFCDRTNPSSLQKKMYGTTDSGIFGYSHFTGGFPGGQAEFVRVPFADSNVLKIPPEVPDEKALFLSDILPTSYHNVVDTGVLKGDVVAIWGLGPIGLYAARWCQLMGASRIIGIDKVPERLAIARDRLGIETVDFSKFSDVTKEIHSMVPGGVDVALECGASFREPKSILHKVQKTLMLETDSPEVINEMLVSVRKGGKCGLIGDYVGFANGVNVGALMEKGIRLIGNGQCPVQKYWEKILYDYVIPGKFDPTFILTHRVPLEDMPKLYAAFDQRQSGVEKVFVETRFSNKPTPGTPNLSRVDEWSSIN